MSSKAKAHSKKNFTPIKRLPRKPQPKPKLVGLFLFGFFSYIFIYMNIVASQNIHPLYFSFVTENPKAVGETLHKLQRTEVYPELLATQRNIYGSSLENEIFKDNDKRYNTILRLEEVLRTAPKSRDILHALSVLYGESGNHDKEAEYLRRAQEIDPAIK